MFKILDRQPAILVPALMFIMGAAPLAGAYLSQYGFGYEPCPLCLYQRGPYGLIVAVSIMMWLLGSGSSLAKFLILCALLFVIDGGIAAYHTGVEQRWWPGLEGCTDNIVANTIEELRAKLTGEAVVVRCDEPALTVFGLSMAAWNFIYATCAAIFTFVLFGRYASN